MLLPAGEGDHILGLRLLVGEGSGVFLPKLLLVGEAVPLLVPVLAPLLAGEGERFLVPVVAALLAGEGERLGIFCCCFVTSGRAKIVFFEKG